MLQEAPGGPRRLQEAFEAKNDAPLGYNAKSVIEMLILHWVFGGQITKHCKLQTKMLAGSVDGAPDKSRLLIQQN